MTSELRSALPGFRLRHSLTGAAAGTRAPNRARCWAAEHTVVRKCHKGYRNDL